MVAMSPVQIGTVTPRPSRNTPVRLRLDPIPPGPTVLAGLGATIDECGRRTLPVLVEALAYSGRDHPRAVTAADGPPPHPRRAEGPAAGWLRLGLVLSQPARTGDHHDRSSAGNPLRPLFVRPAPSVASAEDRVGPPQPTHQQAPTPRPLADIDPQQLTLLRVDIRVN